MSYTSSKAQAGRGSKIAIGPVAGTSSPTYVEIMEIRNATLIEAQFDTEELPVRGAREFRGPGFWSAQVNRDAVAVPRKRDHGGALGRRNECGRRVTRRRPHPLDQRHVAADGFEDHPHRPQRYPDTRRS